MVIKTPMDRSVVGAHAEVICLKNVKCLLTTFSITLKRHIFINAMMWESSNYWSHTGHKIDSDTVRITRLFHKVEMWEDFILFGREPWSVSLWTSTALMLVAAAVLMVAFVSCSVLLVALTVEKFPAETHLIKAWLRLFRIFSCSVATLVQGFMVNWL